MKGEKREKGKKKTKQQKSLNQSSNSLLRGQTNQITALKNDLQKIKLCYYIFY